MQAKVRSEIDRYFKLVLNRPEILNRIGDNILVFDFIRLETAALVFDGMVDGILARGLFDSGTEGGTQVMINALTVEAGGVTNMCLAQTGGRG